MLCSAQTWKPSWEAVLACREDKSGSFLQSLARKLSLALHSVVLVVRKTVPPIFSFTQSSVPGAFSVVMEFSVEDSELEPSAITFSVCGAGAKKFTELIKTHSARAPSCVQRRKVAN